MIYEVTLTHGWLQFFPLVVMQRDARVCQRQLTNLLPARRKRCAGISHHHVSVCLSNAGIVSKRLNVGSRKQHRVIAQGL